jgi:hypothetical protein
VLAVVLVVAVWRWNHRLEEVVSGRGTRRGTCGATLGTKDGGAPARARDSTLDVLVRVEQ